MKMDAPFQEYSAQRQPTRAWQETDWDEIFLSQPYCWAVVDGVNWPEIAGILQQSSLQHECLYSTPNPDSRAMAPWLVRLERDSADLRLFRRRAQDRHSFVLLNSDHSLEEIRRHLRHFTMQRIPSKPDEPVYFRFYDPRVMIDMVESMSPAFVDSFMRPFSSVIAPLSVHCLPPDDVTWSGAPISPFDMPESCQGRLLMSSYPTGKDSRHGRSPEIGAEEFSRLSGRMAERAVNGLARDLHTKYGHLTTANRCLKIAMGAQNAAARFGMRSISQVRVVAQSQLIFGEDFDLRHSEAAEIVNDPELLAWQKKNELQLWFGKLYVANVPGTARTMDCQGPSDAEQLF